ncbi:ABC transporter permease [Bradyrhizobium sp. U87765 SZCCT0131]|uniref:ABC transporter permease n=1 Tax=unclassified Bradyrhizobium TaxID=2631580 RepID=UPI001BA60169|nr:MULTISPECIES: ABC transporter permease [unclassified Bradyrhizobium]MBR1222335.1 ABC transporter permease [Bradyrhizobium sp. U87765 SZCCT0131]MBR1264181.1 ABC transporter permease [Bradyrhizobium sp. U87765 SZCCT0134]MBR1308036.1 ABC transporter permease [Bradyrhizobium sp. U87765 SZCCT0110]MBR1320431.1 ABC transporter permease [Bradyrhizobium sp. U87765 SZCCT0109]MBR1348456.1 ABC transporter permease [Bradyrhizobium sp. U87765 SZCCT0048]
MVDVSVTPTPPPGAMRWRWLRHFAGTGVPYVSLAIFALVVIAAIGGEAIAPHDPNGLDLGAAFHPPVWQAGGSIDHLLGTDNLGRDVLSRIIAGARISLTVALYAIVISGGVGALIGMIAGYFGRWVDVTIMRLVDIQMSIPSLALALVIATVLSPSLTTVIVVISITYWTWYARIVRGEILSLRERDYVALAKVAGCSTPTIFVRHLLPNVLNTLLVLATLQVGQVIIFEASLSFLGLGIQSPDVSWGLMLADARSYIENAWWAITLPGVAIMLTCLSANLIGDWLRDTFDPKRRQL